MLQVNQIVYYYYLIYKDYLLGYRGDTPYFYAPTAYSDMRLTSATWLQHVIHNIDETFSSSYSYNSVYCDTLAYPLSFSSLRVKFSNKPNTSDVISVANKVYLAYIPDDE